MYISSKPEGYIRNQPNIYDGVFPQKQLTTANINFGVSRAMNFCKAFDCFLHGLIVKCMTMYLINLLYNINIGQLQ